LAIQGGDVVLDELAADLDATFRAYRKYVNATTETRPFYDTAFRAFCNEPFHTPLDIFYNLYGNACTACTFASKKRVNLRELAAQQNRFSASQFMSRFGSFIVQSMANAMYLHSVCLAPIEGSCVDHSTDSLWLAEIDDMKAAANESIAVIADTAAALADWVRLIQVADLEKFINEAGVGNQQIADNVFANLTAAQPDFFFQILVGDKDQDFNDFNLFRQGCNKRDEDCSTVEDKTGHLYVDSDTKFLSIRYRLKAAPSPPQTVSIGTSNSSFPEFYNALEDRLNQETVVSLNRPDGKSCSQDIRVEAFWPTRSKSFGKFSACWVDICFECSEAEVSELNRVLVSKSYFIRRVPGERPWMNIGEKVDDPINFPTFEATFDGDYLFGAGQVDRFIWYYN
jgi:hypothetical protein